MSKKKKAFIIVYVIALIAIVTLILSKIFAAGNSGSQLSGNVQYAAYEANEVGTPRDEIIAEGNYKDETDVENKAHGNVDDDDIGFVHEDLQFDDDVFCFAGEKHLFLRAALTVQKIVRANSVNYTGYHDNVYYVDENENPIYVLVDNLTSSDTKYYKDRWTSTPFSLMGKRYFVSQVVNLSVLKVDKYPTSYAESYILAQKDNPDYQALYTRDGTSFKYSARQFAIWELKKGSTQDSYIGDDKPIAKKLYTEATEFETFRNDFKLPKLNSNSSDYEFKYNIEGDYFIAGPVKMDYSKLTLDSEVVVGEITGAELYGTNSNGKKDQTVPFEITDENGNKQDFPTSGGQFTFYIKVQNSTVKSNKIKEITNFKVKFKYLDATGYGYTITDPTKHGIEYYKWIQAVKHNNCYIFNCAGQREYISNCQNDDHTYCSDDKCTKLHTIYHDKTYQLQRESRPRNYAEWQPLFAFGEAKLFWRYYELEITFKQDSLPTYIDLGGKVWIDGRMDNGKVIDNADGIINNGELGRENVLVELFFFDGTSVKVKQNEVVEDKRNTNLINPSNGQKVAYNNTTYGYAMYTDSNGEYMFYGLPVDQKYYVRFTYDGQTYTITQYLADDGNEGRYINNPNQTKYDNNSKVKDELDRPTFNNKFGVITYENIGARDTGKAEGTSPILKYFNNKYKESGVDYIKSKIITTDNNRDAEYGETGTPQGPNKQTGKVIDPFKIQARTPNTLKYPFEKENEIIIYSAREPEILNYLQHINLGLKFRQRADFQLSTQLKAGATTIKDKEKVVIYPQSAKKEDLSIDFTRQEDEYIKQEISAADYNWRTQFTKIYGDGEPIDGTGATGYVVDEEKLHVYVLYRIAIKNQCEDVNDYGIINEIIDYYDDRLERVPRNEIAKASRLFREAGLKVSSTAYDSWIEGTNRRVDWISSGSYGNYRMMKSTTPITVGANNGESAVYLMLKVRDTDSVLDGNTIPNGRLETGTDRSDRDGMQNIAEIGSYTVKNGNDFVGKIDKDSAPGNATPGDKKTYEDDTDASPMFRLEINWTPKEIKGNVWDDTVGATAGEKDGIEVGIENVTVKLVEHIVQEDGTVKEVERPGIEFVNSNQSVKTDRNGNYSFYVEGGNYSLKFIYGDQEMLQTNKKYNAQDYQATKPYSALSSGNVPGYNQSDKLKAFATNADLVTGIKNFLVVGQEGENGDLGWWNQNWNIGDMFADKKGSQSKKENEGVSSTVNNVSSARDKATIRADIIKNTQDLIYDNASILNKLNADITLSSSDAISLSGGNTAEPRHEYKGDGNCTYMEAVSDIIVIASNDLITEPNVINLGLKERPTASRKLEKKVDRIILTASDGTVLIDTDDDTKQSGLQKMPNGKGEVDIQQTFINLEPGLMDGALLDIYYTVTVTNDSNTDDCLNNYVYVSGTVTTGDLRNDDHQVMSNLGTAIGGYGLTTPLPIKATIFDYVNINLEYRAEDNSNGTIWDIVYEESGNTGNSKNEINDGWLSDTVKEGIQRTQKKVSKVLQTNTSKFDNDGLTAGQSVQIPIHLGITLSEDTSGKNLNDFDFSNCAELTQIITTAGRRDYETVPGDYVPYDTDENNKKQEDAYLTGTTAITPPLGEGRFYYVIAIISATIVVVGIVLIKKKVLKK